MSHTEPTYSDHFTVDTSGVLLEALYLRDLAGLRGVGSPALPPVVPTVRSVDARRITEHVGGQSALRVEWEAWWHGLLRHRVSEAVLPLPPRAPFIAVDWVEFDCPKKPTRLFVRRGG